MLGANCCNEDTDKPSFCFDGQRGGLAPPTCTTAYEYTFYARGGPQTEIQHSWANLAVLVVCRLGLAILDVVLPVGVTPAVIIPQNARAVHEPLALEVPMNLLLESLKTVPVVRPLL